MGGPGGQGETSARPEPRHRVAPGRIREWRPGDAPAVAALLPAVAALSPAVRRSDTAEHPTLPALGPAREGSGAIAQTLIVETEGGIVAVGTVGETRLHPAHWRLAIHVGQGHRRQGVGSALVRSLADEAAAVVRRPLRAGTRAGDTVGPAFLARHGFRHPMRTRLGRFDAESVDAEAAAVFAAEAERVAAAGYRIVAVGAAAPGGTRDARGTPRRAARATLSGLWLPSTRRCTGRGTPGARPARSMTRRRATSSSATT